MVVILPQDDVMVGKVSTHLNSVFVINWDGVILETVLSLRVTTSRQCPSNSYQEQQPSPDNFRTVSKIECVEIAKPQNTSIARL